MEFIMISEKNYFCQENLTWLFFIKMHKKYNDSTTTA